MHLRQDALLQGGKYIIRQVLGQGGFGITYLGEQTGLGRKVAIKEFFMKELCNRDETTSQVSVGSEGSREMVARFREKFIKEARLIAGFDNNHIVRIHDIFEENGTAYYVMENIDGGSLSALLEQKGRLPEAEAIMIIRQVADALGYIHAQNVLHLDVKPSNILMRHSDEAVLIDFGISKRYDETGSQTSSSPAGISKGYAPLEQYNQGLQSFAPATDVYSLGATLYRMVTGSIPPEASIVNEDGLPARPAFVSASLWSAIEAAMQPRRKDRPQTIAAWLDLLNNNIHARETASEATILTDDKPKIVDDSTKMTAAPKPIAAKPSAPKPAAKSASNPKPAANPKPSNKKPFIIAALVAVVAFVLGFVVFSSKGGDNGDKETEGTEQIAQNAPAVTEEPAKPEPAKPTPAPQPVAEDKPSVYKVKFTCNVPTAELFIDKALKGNATSELYLEEGTYAVKVTAEGYKEHSGNLTVSSQTKPYKITLTENPKPVVVQEPAKPIPVPVPVNNNAATDTHNGHEWVDLGLPSGTKWATMNVGASSPSDYGSYFAWGETKPKSNYYWSTYKWCNGSGDSQTKYCTSSSYGTVDNKKTLDLSDDAARANWGGDWRMPSRAQQDELREKCKWTWTTMGGHNGYKVVGPNGKSIFLPAAGCRYESSLCNDGTFGYYWSSSLSTGDSYYAYYLYFNSGAKNTRYDKRCNGQSVRPVRQ